MWGGCWEDIARVWGRWPRREESRRRATNIWPIVTDLARCERERSYEYRHPTSRIGEEYQQPTTVLLTASRVYVLRAHYYPFLAEVSFNQCQFSRGVSGGASQAGGLTIPCLLRRANSNLVCELSAPFRLPVLVSRSAHQDSGC